MEQAHDFVAQVTLDGNLSVLCGSADAALDLQGLAECLEVLVGPGEAGDQRNLLPAAVPAVQGYDQTLPVGRKRVLQFIEDKLLTLFWVSE